MPWPACPRGAPTAAWAGVVRPIAATVAVATRAARRVIPGPSSGRPESVVVGRAVLWQPCIRWNPCSVHMVIGPFRGGGVADRLLAVERTRPAAARKGGDRPMPEPAGDEVPGRRRLHGTPLSTARSSLNAPGPQRNPAVGAGDPGPAGGCPECRGRPAATRPASPGRSR